MRAPKLAALCVRGQARTNEKKSDRGGWEERSVMSLEQIRVFAI